METGKLIRQYKESPSCRKKVFKDPEANVCRVQ